MKTHKLQLSGVTFLLAIQEHPQTALNQLPQVYIYIYRKMRSDQGYSFNVTYTNDEPDSSVL